MNTLSIRQPWAGSFLEISLEGSGPEPVLQREAGKAFDLMRFVKRLMNCGDPDSDLSRLNSCAFLAPLRVHPWTHQALGAAISLSGETEGAFDITVMPRTVPGGPAGRHQSFTGLREAGQWEDIQLLPDSGVRFRRQLRVDLRDIMTGFAMDKAIAYLANRREITRAALTAGGETRTCGAGAHALLASAGTPGKDSATPAVMLRPAVSTAPAWFARGPAGAYRASPILHPRSGKPMRSNYSVSVFSKTSMEAGALIRSVLLSPQVLWNRLLTLHDSIALVFTTKGEQVLFPV